ncbi:MAG: hypothetical protein J3K34DRAFT_471960 [Monoraphidium minutum]|nr:MAG: hypothetical protein J3K34DRAFT_471960 [Monoraphidium minutum]
MLTLHVQSIHSDQEDDYISYLKTIGLRDVATFPSQADGASKEGTLFLLPGNTDMDDFDQQLVAALVKYSLLSMHAVLVPTVADAFNFQAVKRMGEKLPQWLDKYDANRARSAGSKYPLPSHRPKFLGNIINAIELAGHVIPFNMVMWTAKIQEAWRDLLPVLREQDMALDDAFYAAHAATLDDPAAAREGGGARQLQRLNWRACTEARLAWEAGDRDEDAKPRAASFMEPASDVPGLLKRIEQVRAVFERLAGVVAALPTPAAAQPAAAPAPEAPLAEEFAAKASIV